MKGLLLKDWYTLTKQLKFTLGLLVVLTILPGYSTVSFALLYSAMLPITALAYDERSKWDELAAMMPYSVRQIVGGKYVLGVASIVVAVLISAVAQGLMGLVQKDFAVQEVLTMVCFMAFLAVVLVSVDLPIMYAFGVERGRVMFMVICAMVAGIGVGISEPLMHLLNRLELGVAPFLVLPTVAIVILLISMEISIKLYQKRKR